jgi:3-phosphoshikimate 1-carboxyvinyltransferase
MRLLAGMLASAPLRSVLVGDESLSARPMERVAAPLRRMGATVRTTDGHAPMQILGGALHGIRFEPEVPSAQVKSAVLLAGTGAEGPTEVLEPVPTRDHTERALAALGAEVRRDGQLTVVSGPFQHEGFAGTVPGDASSAAFLVAAAALSGTELEIEGVSLNPSRLRFLEVLGRMGVTTTSRITGEQVGEPVGVLGVSACDQVRSTTVTEEELPLVIDEVPILAVVASFAPSDSWFLGAGELRVKESDRLHAVAQGLRGLGGQAAAEGDDLVVAGGGLNGGRAASGGDHRLAMAFAVAGIGARAPVEVDAMEAADVSYPGFVGALRRLGARVQEVG